MSGRSWRSRSAPPPRGRALWSPDFENANRVNFFIADAQPLEDPHRRGAHTARRARPSSGRPTGSGQRRIAYRPLKDCPDLAEEVVARGEPEAFWVPRHAREYVDMDFPPDECFWYANVAIYQHHAHEEHANRELHEMQNWLHRGLDQSLTDFAQSRDVQKLKDDIRIAAELAHDISSARFAQYAQWIDRCSNNRARMLELQAYSHFAHGLLVLATHLDPAEQDHADANVYRYCSNAVIAD